MQPDHHWTRSKLVTLAGVILAHLFALVALELAMRHGQGEVPFADAFVPLEAFFVEERQPEEPPVPPAATTLRRLPALPVSADASPAPSDDESTAPTALPPVDWQLEAELAVQRFAESLPVEPSTPRKAGKKREFGWSRSRIQRIEQTEDGATLFWINDRCVLVNFVMPFCKFGKIPPRGDLFEGMQEMHDNVLER